MRLLVFLILLSVDAFCQEPIDTLLTQLKSTPYSVPLIQQIVAQRGTSQAKAIMEEALASAFKISERSYLMNTASLISVALLTEIDNKHPEALAYLRRRVQEAVALTAPAAFSPRVTASPAGDSSDPAQFTPEFLTWVLAQGDRQPIEELYLINQYGQDLIFLGLAGGQESIDLVARGLGSQQFSIVMGALRALVQLGAVARADDALVACERVADSAEQRYLFGVPLMGFADKLPGFDRKVSRFLKDDTLFKELERSHRNTGRE